MSSPLMQAMQEATGLSEAQILRLVARSPHAYKIYTIPKKSGGLRTIAQPAKETKYVQRWLMINIFVQLPLHESAVAYKLGASIKKNADLHRKNSYISKFDFQNFFPSIKEVDLVSHFTKHLADRFTSVDIQYMARLCCISSKGTKDRCLSIGAPSSPMLSNSVMYEFDSLVDSWCKPMGIVYTRYADDLTFSTNEKGISTEIEKKIADFIHHLDYPKLRLNNKKTAHLSKKYQRRVTGLIINNEDEISIGRERKRAISALIHRCSINMLSMEEKYNLQGLLGFAKDVEPTFVMRMRKKYGSEIIDSVFQIRKPGK